MAVELLASSQRQVGNQLRSGLGRDRLSALAPCRTRSSSCDRMCLWHVGAERR
jgi:hypothetical protein